MLIMQMREKHPTWGARKLLWALKGKYPRAKSWPAPSTIGDILKRKGLVRKIRRRKKTPESFFPFSDVKSPIDDHRCIQSISFRLRNSSQSKYRKRYYGFYKAIY